MAEKNNSLGKALAVLDLFQTSDRLTLTNIVQNTGYSNASVSRILNTLEDANYIFQDRINGGWYLADKFFALGRRTQLNRQIVNVLDEPIARLCRRSGFSVTVSVRNGTRSLTALRKDPQRGLTLIPGVGDSMSLNVTASGKVLVAFSEDRDRLVQEIGYVRLTRKSITDRDEFRELLGEIRTEKLAFDVEEITEGLVCVAAPVLSAAGTAICAISVSGYKERMLRELYNLIPRLRDTVAECEKLLR
jgi:DNA-binding IclR family transcriptional regulator